MKNKQKLEDLPDVLTVREVADIYRVIPLTIKRWIRRGKLKGIKINERGDIRFLKSHIEITLKYWRSNDE